MIAIIDNGRDAEKLCNLIRGARVFKPSAAPKDANAYILSDGDFSEANKNENIKLIKSGTRPIVGIGIGQLYIASAFGAHTKQSECPKTDYAAIKQNSPILLDMKRRFAVSKNQKLVLADLPNVFGIMASSPKNQFEVIQHGANIDNPIDALPLFGVHFNPEAGGDALQILRNFEHFVEMWAKYHKNL